MSELPKWNTMPSPPPPPPSPCSPEVRATYFETKRIGGLWYCYATHRGYDYSFCSDCEYYAVELAKAIMSKNGWIKECRFPEF